MPSAARRFSVQPTTPENLLANRDLLPDDAHPLLYETLGLAYSHMKPTPDDGIILTDDRAPTELLTDMILVNFVLSGSNELPCQ